MKTFKKFAPVIATLFGVLAIVMLFLPAIGYAEDKSFTGFQAIFGYTETTKVPVIGTEIKTEMLAFSFMNLLPVLCVAAGVVLCLLSFVGKGNKFFAFIAAVCFIVAAVLFFLTVSFAVAGKAVTLEGTLAQSKVKESWTLGVGPILAAIFSIFAAGSVAAPTFLK